MNLIMEYLGEVMAKTVEEKFQKFPHRASVFRQPVEGSAFENFGARELLEKVLTSP